MGVIHFVQAAPAYYFLVQSVATASTPPPSFVTLQLWLCSPSIHDINNFNIWILNNQRRWWKLGILCVSWEFIPLVAKLWRFFAVSLKAINLFIREHMFLLVRCWRLRAD